MARKTKAEAEKTRRRILLAALELFAAKGYRLTTFDDIGARIGLTKGAVYWHFKDKERLLLDLVAHITSAQAADLAKRLPTEAALDSAEALSDHFARRAVLIAGSQTYRRFFLMLRRLTWTAHGYKNLAAQVRQVSSAPYAVILRALEAMRTAGGIDARTDVAQIAMLLLVQWLGVLDIAILQMHEIDLEKSVRLVFEAVLAQVSGAKQKLGEIG